MLTRHDMKYNSYILAITRKGKKGNRVTLHQRLYLNGEQWQVPLGISLPAEYYDKKLQRAIGPDCEKENLIIGESLNTIRDVILRYELIEHKSPSPQQIYTEYLKTMKDKGLIGSPSEQNSVSTDMASMVDVFVAEESRNNGWSVGTKRRFNSFKKDLEYYNTENDTVLRFDTLSEKALYDFLYCIQERKNLLNTTLAKKASVMRWYLRWAYKKGLYQGDLHNKFTPKLKGGNFEHKNIIYLTVEELQKLEHKTFDKSQQHLEHIRDVFLFACYSGLRFSDIQALAPYQIHDDVIEVVTIKTENHITINLNKYTRAIIEKYADWAKATNRVLPVISNQKTNDALHALCELCEINTPTLQVYHRLDKKEEVWLPKYELITFHASRRTFITHALRLGIPPEVIMKFSGHQKREMLDPYMAVVDELKKKEMAKFDSM